MKAFESAFGVADAYADAFNVRREVWRSVVSLLHSYAGAAGLSGEACIVSEPFLGAVVLQGLSKELKLSLNFESGQGVLVSRLRGEPAEERAFQISAAGILRVAGEERELDAAAIDWLAESAGREFRGGVL